MPQHFQVLRCYKCLVFQVHQTKKSNKFDCKLCGEKQSIKRHYGLGTGKECRVHVQKLNGIRVEVDQVNTSQYDSDYDEEENDYQSCKEILDNTQLKKESKWLEYVENTEECIDEATNESMFLGNTEVVLEIPKKCRAFNRSKGKKAIGNDPYVENVPQSHGSNSIDECKSLDFQSICTKAQNNIKEESFRHLTQERKNTASKYTPVVANKKSKWAQYCDTTKQNFNYEDSFIQSQSYFKESQTNEGDIEGRKICNTFESSENSNNKDITCANEENKKNIQKRKIFSIENLSPEKKAIIFAPVTNKQSKWAQYADETLDNMENENELSNQRYQLSKDYSKPESQKLFSLCDDSDLDKVLDI